MFLIFLKYYTWLIQKSFYLPDYPYECPVFVLYQYQVFLLRVIHHTLNLLVGFSVFILYRREITQVVNNFWVEIFIFIFESPPQTISDLPSPSLITPFLFPFLIYDFSFLFLIHNFSVAVILLIDYFCLKILIKSM